MRLHGKIVRLLDFSLKCVKVMMGHLHALDILTRGADEVVVMVVRVKQFVPLHSIKDIDLREDLFVRQEIELAIDGCFVY
jgi:hypothetical protein